MSFKVVMIGAGSGFKPGRRVPAAVVVFHPNPKRRAAFNQQKIARGHHDLPVPVDRPAPDYKPAAGAPGDAVQIGTGVLLQGPGGGVQIEVGNIDAARRLPVDVQNHRPKTLQADPRNRPAGAVLFFRQRKGPGGQA